MPPLMAAITPMLGVVGGTGAAAGAASGWLGAASLIGTGLKVVGDISQANTESKIMEANARNAEIQAKSIQESAKSETFRLSKERNQMIGTQAALTGAAGVDISSGSPLEIMAETARSYESDIQNLGYMGDTKAATKNFEASIYDWGASQKRRAGWINAGTDLFSGISTMGRAAKWGL